MRTNVRIGGYGNMASSFFYAKFTVPIKEEY